MTLTDAQKTVIADIATGKAIDSAIAIKDQIAALREQMDLVLAANSKVAVCEKYKKFSDTVSEKKSKADETTKTEKPK